MYVEKHSTLIGVAENFGISIIFYKVAICLTELFALKMNDSVYHLTAKQSRGQNQNNPKQMGVFTGDPSSFLKKTKSCKVQKLLEMVGSYKK